MGESNRAFRMRKLIRDSFLELLESKGIEHITVSEVIEKAHIGRTTFYNYYNDIYDLLLDCIKSNGGVEFRREPDRLASNFIEQLYQNILDGVLQRQKYQTVYKATSKYKSSQNSMYIDNIKEETEAHIRHVLTEIGLTDATSVVPLDYVIDLFSNMFQNINDHWAVAGFQESPEEVAHISAVLFHRISHSLMRDCPLGDEISFSFPEEAEQNS